MNEQDIYDIISARDFSLWQKHIFPEMLSKMSIQEYQNLCNECVDRDWGQGVGHLRDATRESRHDWYWVSPSGIQSPGNAFFRAAQHAKVQCMRELVQGMSVTTLKHATLLASRTAARPLKMTQNRIRSLSYIAKELNSHTKKEIKDLGNSLIFVQAVLENKHIGVIKSFHDVWDKNDVWNLTWSQVKPNYLSGNGKISLEPHIRMWIEGLEFLWQVTENYDEIPEQTRMELMEAANHPQNASLFPYIHSQLSKQEIIAAIEGAAKNPLKPRKKM